jgi:drug/metabolite transporter (DMT)-like permease
VGVWSGLAAGAWLGAAEAPTKLVVTGLSPVLVSFCMVIGVFVGRWSMPALIHGVSYVRTDVRQAPHLVIWAVLGGGLWAIANTLTVFAIHDVGLSIAFPLWNTNSLIGLVWGVLFFNELRGASRLRLVAVVGGGVIMCVAAAMVGAAAASQSGAPAHTTRGIVAALTAGLLWGTMYIPYRKAYITGLSPLSFLTFFTIGEVLTMAILALDDAGGPAGLARTLLHARPALLWLFLGGFVWVVGDMFQQYAAKYIGISRGIPLSNTNQLWGLAWGVLVFGELRGAAPSSVALIIGGSLLMVGGAAVIALAGADDRERLAWDAAANREMTRYAVADSYTHARAAGHDPLVHARRRSVVDWIVIVGATAVFFILGMVAMQPELPLHGAWAAVLSAVLVAAAIACGSRLWRTTRFV